jgi:molecular chaperone GrpE
MAMGADDTGPAAADAQAEAQAQAAFDDGARAEADAVATAGAAAAAGDEVGVDDALMRAVADLRDLEEAHRRLAADFANYRRRVERDRAQWEEAARGDVLIRLLPVFDNLRRARGAASAESGGGANGALVAGLDMVLRGLDETLGALGVRETVHVGDPFDPVTCEALGEDETLAVPPGRVSQVLQAGYQLGERVLRPALVRVAASPAGSGAASADGATDAADAVEAVDASPSGRGGQL